MTAFTEWFQSRLHRECDTVIDLYDQARRSSAEAHRQAEEALAAERAQSARLRAELEEQTQRADRAEEALDRAQEVAA